ncbi:laminin subunit alpha-1 [Caerostris extrusa]|uniref:Laminin subunit alpha-1 n=1 Tax=Caerostris extrusa TaxID=172846 RepID=A0AAV4PGU9_CAEEX|nr:laminin subunit alpha-1 [Caerostris extrusa]
MKAISVKGILNALPNIRPRTGVLRVTLETLKCLLDGPGNECAPEHFGNAAQRYCEPCSCNPKGSLSTQCDLTTGQCICKPGIVGRTCNRCAGSLSIQCDESNGQCRCKPHVVGRMCDRCQDGYWNLQSGNGCEQCQCNRTGSSASVCDKNTGHNCKPGIGGRFVISVYQVISCFLLKDVETKTFQLVILVINLVIFVIQQMDACVCPPFTTGNRCQKCVRNAWGFDPVRGCKPCDCNRKGSPQQSCDPNTVESHCRNNICQCNNQGDCPCKELVSGQRCDRCVDGSFGLSKESKKGCYDCFCFGKNTNL